jgi:DNA uptake protein ComE-like DNA-binding protein
MSNPQQQGKLLIEETVKDLENPKSSISSSIKKLKRAAILLNENDVSIWCDIQLGDNKYTTVLTTYVESYIAYDSDRNEVTKKRIKLAEDNINKSGIKFGKHINNEELTVKATISGGGFVDIAFIEEKYNDLVRSKRGNDDTYFKTNLQNTLAVVKTIAHRLATEIYKNHAFKELAESNFNVLKRNVEDVLFDLDAELAEKMMLAFKAVSSDKSEEWSHALTTCRRFIEQLADKLYPASDEKLNGRLLGKANHINRLWAFMDKAIESDTNKTLAKAHVDFLGAYLQNLYKISNKGVHSGLKRLEALKSVMHIYLMCADMLQYLKKDASVTELLNIHTATLDELESFGNVTRTIAKEIVRIRVERGVIVPEDLKRIPKLGDKMLSAIKSNFRFDPFLK